MTRVAIVVPQPAVRTGLALLLRGEPGLVPVGAAAGSDEAHGLISRERPDVVLLEPQLRAGDGIAFCRRLKSSPRPPRVIFYTSPHDADLELLAHVAGADGLVDNTGATAELFEAIRLVARGGRALPSPTRGQLAAAAHRVEPDDLALLAMLMDHTSPADVADTLGMDQRRVARRIERVIGRLRRPPERAAA